MIIMMTIIMIIPHNDDNDNDENRSINGSPLGTPLRLILNSTGRQNTDHTLQSSS